MKNENCELKIRVTEVRRTAMADSWGDSIMNPEELSERLLEFAARVGKVVDALPDTRLGRHVAGQLVRSGTAPAAHYAEARGAESTKDFIHKLRLCLKELNESRVWLKITTRSEMLPASRLHDINRECDKLCRIINASIQTTQKRP